MRGDRPSRLALSLSSSKFTPHARGSTGAHLDPDRRRAVYPACAGIDRLLLRNCKFSFRLPRMRGDRPLEYKLVDFWLSFTPHARGSTAGPHNLGGKGRVYPACAGIDPVDKSPHFTLLRLRRMRGDRPIVNYPHQLPRKFTPHARGST